KKEHLAENAMAMGQYFRERLRQLNHPNVLEVRGKGLLNAIVIKHDDPNAAWDLCLLLKEAGLLAKPTHGDKIRFAPPLTITKEQIEACTDIIADCLNRL